MRDLALDDNGDLLLENGDAILTSGIDSIKQYLSQRIKTYLGEWFLDNRRGIPYYQHIFKKNYDPVVIDSIFKQAILTTPGVVELLSFDIEIDNALRTLSLSFKAKTMDGIINIDNYEVS